MTPDDRHQTSSPGGGRGRRDHAAGPDDQPDHAQPARRHRGHVAVVAQGPVVQLPVPAARRRRPRPAVQRRGVPVHREPAGRARGDCGRGRGARRRPAGDRTVHHHTQGHHQARLDGLDAHVQRAAAAHGAGRGQRVRPGRRAPAAQPGRAGQAVLLGRVRRRAGRVPGRGARVRRQLALHALRQHHRHTFGRFHGKHRRAQVKLLPNVLYNN